MANFKKTLTNEQDATSRSIEIPSSGAIDRTQLHEELANQFEVIDPSADLNKIAEHERFMNQYVECKVEDSNNQYDEQEIVVGHNGMVQTFIRGLEQKVRRKFVYVLATAKTDSINDKQVVGRDGEKVIRSTVVSVPKYTISILEDTREGREWFKRIRAEPV
jgi:hypothetical protein